jgi:hypothetical protein
MVIVKDCTGDLRAIPSGWNFVGMRYAEVLWIGPEVDFEWMLQLRTRLEPEGLEFINRWLIERYEWKGVPDDRPSAACPGESNG